MAASLPVVALAVDGVSETVKHGVTGYLVAPPGIPTVLADALRECLDEPERGMSMGAKGRERVESEFSAGRTAREVAESTSQCSRT